MINAEIEIQEMSDSSYADGSLFNEDSPVVCVSLVSFSPCISELFNRPPQSLSLDTHSESTGYWTELVNDTSTCVLNVLSLLSILTDML